MQALIRYYNDAFDACMAPLSALGRWAELLGVAAVLGIVVSLIFAALVRRERLRQARDELWAALFEIWLYRREPLLVWQAQLALLKANLRYSSISFDAARCFSTSKYSLVNTGPLPLCLCAHPERN